MIKPIKDTNDYLASIQEVTYTCTCGHKLMIPKEKKKQICWSCKNYVCADKKLEFIEKLKKELRKVEVMV